MLKTKQKFSIRKFSTGVGSVLLGTLFLGNINNLAKAEEITTFNNIETVTIQPDKEEEVQNASIIYRYIDENILDSINEPDGDTYKLINPLFLKSKVGSTIDLMYGKKDVILHSELVEDFRAANHDINISHWEYVKTESTSDVVNKDVPTEVRHFYRPVFINNITKYIDNITGSTIEEVEGKVTDYKEIPNYSYVTTETLENGDIIHKYNKIPKIKYITPEGEEIPDTDGADFEDEYTIVEERTGDSGETIRVAHKITTTYVDEKENIIEKVNKKVPNHKEIPNYIYVTTETKDNGNIVHKYNKVPTITYVDENGLSVDKIKAEDPTKYKVISEKDKGNGDIEKTVHKIITKYVDNKTVNTVEEVEGKVTNHKEIPHYTYITTETLSNGDIVHKYSKNPTIVYTDENSEALTSENALDINKYTLIRESGDKDKNTITKVYHKITTTYKDDNGKVIETVDGKEIAPKVVERYTHTDTTVEDDGDVVHTYSEIPYNPTITYVNKNGENIPKVDAEDSNKYIVVSEKDKGNGNIERTVHKIVTKYVYNKTGNTIEEVEGKVTEHKEIPNYTYVSTETLDNGDAIHKYNKTKDKITIISKDEDGNILSEKEVEDLDKYYPIKEEKTNDKIVRIYHKITTTYVDENDKVLDKKDGKDTTKRDIPNYTFNGFTIKQNGDIIHKYIVNKIESPTVVYTDENGEVLTPENALDSTKYSSIRENVTKDKNIITKVYHKIITNYVDEDNKVIGTVESKVSEYKEIHGYTYITTETLSNGDIVHKYNKVKEEVDVNTEMLNKNNNSKEEIETNNKETLDYIYTTKKDSNVNKEKVDTLKELPKTNTNSTYMYTLTSLVGLALLLKRKQSC